MLSRLSPNLKKEKDLWNKILLCVEVGDKVRFKYGKAIWSVYALPSVTRGGFQLQVIKLKRFVRSKMSIVGYRIDYKEVWQGTKEYRNLRIVSK